MEDPGTSVASHARLAVRRNYRKLGYLLVGALAIWTAFAFSMPHWIPDPARAGQFGDMFGAINALFSAAAFAALTYAVLLQMDALKAQEAQLLQSVHTIQAEREAARRATLMSAITTLITSYDAQLASAGTSDDPHYIKMLAQRNSHIRLLENVVQVELKGGI